MMSCDPYKSRSDKLRSAYSVSEKSAIHTRSRTTDKFAVLVERPVFPALEDLSQISAMTACVT